MPAPTPPLTVAKPTAGVLPISAVTNRPDAPPKVTNSRPPHSKTKLLIRRLPPGLKQEELEHALGDEWKSGKGKVSWALFKPGKPSQDLSKPSRPARAYLQVTDHTHVEPLARIVNTTVFADAKGTSNDPALIGPPCLEYAPYSRVPGGKRRNDARQGTIDQDPEFIEFLESLTNPISKPKALESDNIKDDNVKITPLIQHLRDKKASKERALQNKAGKHARHESKEPTNGKGDKKANSTSKDAPQSSKAKGARGTKENEKAGKNSVKSPLRDGKAGTSSNSQGAVSAAAAASTSKKDEKGTSKAQAASGTSAAARIIQRDLGLRGGRRGGRADAQGKQSNQEARNADTASPTNATAVQTGRGASSGSSTKAESNGSASNTKPIQPIPANRAQNNPSQPPTQFKAQASAADAAQGANASGRKPVKSSVDPTATRAFLKHANPSQGITEEILRAAISVHGAVTHVEIDKRKGFAYADFADPAGLQAAVAASPIAVAQGSVQVLERNDRSRAAAPPPGPAAGAQSVPSRGGRGGGPAGSFRGRGRGGSSRGGFARGAASTAAVPNAAQANGASSKGNSDAATAPMIASRSTAEGT